MCNCECDVCYDNCPGDMSKNYPNIKELETCVNTAKKEKQ